MIWILIASLAMGVTLLVINAVLFRGPRDPQRDALEAMEDDEQMRVLAQRRWERETKRERRRATVEELLTAFIAREPADEPGDESRDPKEVS